MKKFYLILLILLFAPPAFAGQTINITTDLSNKVYGNSDTPDGFGLPTLDPNYNTVNFATSGISLSNFSVYGGWFNGSDVSGNAVIITVSELISSGFNGIYGGYAENGSVINNRVSVSSLKSVFMNIYGGIADKNATNNIVELKNLNAGNYIFMGGSSIDSGETNHEVSGNIISIEGGTYNIGDIYGGEFHSSSVTTAYNAQIKNNVINISGGTFDDVVMVAGYLNVGSRFPQNSVINNGINISGNATFINSHIYGSDGGSVMENNFINIKNGNFQDTVIAGGYVSVTSSGNPTFEVSGNIVSIEGGTFSGTIYGGYAENSSNASLVKDNIVNISGNSDLTNAYLYGGYNAGNTGEISGNTLNLSTSINVKVASGFDNYNFSIDSSNVNSNSMLHAADSATDMDNTTVGLYLKDSSTTLHVGDTIWLVENMNANTINQAFSHIKVGATMLYDWELLIDGNNLYAIINKDINPPPPPCEGEDCNGGGDGNGGDNGGGAGYLNPETKSLLEGNISSLGVLIQGADLIVDSGISALDAGVFDGRNGMFSAVSGGSVKLNSGSYVNVQSGSLILGLGKKLNRSLFGIFVEGGGGKHNTFNRLEDSIVRGNGNNTYAGGGLLGRLGSENIYVDSSVRGGYALTSYSADYSPDAKYNIGSLYYGGHVGFGLIQNRNNWSFTEYVKYLATIQQGNNVILDTKEEIRFANMMSSRAVAGLRGKYNGVYLGYAYEQELNGEAKGTASNAKHSNLVMESPIIKGGTSVLEA
ncbi:MAG: hypothetical protein LBQ34_04360, partial [Alphaproteobacteria bacterium]|nr:hypothetical protein [Alphaproteobacteria bacterium]